MSNVKQENLSVKYRWNLIKGKVINYIQNYLRDLELIIKEYRLFKK